MRRGETDTSMCSRMMSPGLAPTLRDATTKSRDLSEGTCDRIMRATPAQPSVGKVRAQVGQDCNDLHYQHSPLHPGVIQGPKASTINWPIASHENMVSITVAPPTSLTSSCLSGDKRKRCIAKSMPVESRMLGQAFRPRRSGHRLSTPAVSCPATLAIASRTRNGKGEISGELGPIGRIGRVGIDQHR